MWFLGALVLASTVASGVENARFASPNGELVLVVRHYPGMGDFDERMDHDEYWARYEVEELTREREATRGAIYRLWPGEYRELVGEFAFEPGEQYAKMLVSNDGYVVTSRGVPCGATAELLTIRARHGGLVRKFRARDVLTMNDHQWLCRGAETDVRLALGEFRTLRLTMLTTDGNWDDADARHHAIDIDLETGSVPAPERDHCPAALLVTAEPQDGASQWLLDRIITRVQPEYPDVAAKARIAGKVGVRVSVGTNGRVQSVEIVKPLPFGCDEAVRKAVLQWEFPPDELPRTATIVFRFQIVRNVRIAPPPIS